MMIHIDIELYNLFLEFLEFRKLKIERKAINLEKKISHPWGTKMIEYMRESDRILTEMPSAKTQKDFDRLKVELAEASRNTELMKKGMDKQSDNLHEWIKEKVDLEYKAKEIGKFIKEIKWINRDQDFDKV